MYKKTGCLALFLVAGCLLLPPEGLAQVAVFGKSDKSGMGEWLSGVTLVGQIEGGIMANPARPDNGINFGNFLADHANQVQLNQLEFTLARAIDPSKNAYQIGFTLEGLYGSDARYYHLLGISDRAISDRYQLIPAQAHIDVHLPWLTSGGLDMQAGILQAPMGVETLDPTTRPFYTLAYTSEYSVPFQHVGAMFKWHVNTTVDVTFGVDTGNQTTFGNSDNNHEAAGYFGFNLNGLAGGKLNIIELSRVGPENAIAVLGARADSQMRYWNDINAAYQVNDKLSVTGEFNYLHDDGIRADTYSFVSFLSYKVTPSLTFNYRGEIYRDNTGQFVVSFLSNTAYMGAIAGATVPAEFAPPTTYGALSLGVTYKPDLGHGVRVFELRPEIRFDRSLNGTTPFNDGRNTGMFTFGMDGVLGF
ncbi:outer membrane beta-barrel protein [Gluconacetobacter johannae]|uniref:Outer membrane beta-barrel protein n=1 Tax=Gluconacetobacter johannae TaxID=112140 RepID=A0A7W4P501_9PROT|nr:outer membrane beta-barrel protein [Gluconacetobacter johannae]MBB2177552.1 outer membrane beta-barrel protein [Gluconacetobacter johannae]